MCVGWGGGGGGGCWGIADRTFIKVQIRIDLRFVFIIYIKYNSGGQRLTLHKTEILNLDLNFNYKE